MTIDNAVLRRPDFLRRLGVTLAVVAIYRIGCWIPLPGLDIPTLVAVFDTGSTRQAIERVSVMGLGVSPWLSMLILAEVTMIALPALRRWSLAKRASFDGWIILGTLALAALQANGIAVALEQAGTLVAGPGLAFRAGIIATLVCATALLMWLASLVSRFGLGSGFLLLLAVPHVIDLTGTLAAQTFAWDDASKFTIPLTVAVFAATAAALISTAERRAPRAAIGQILWPPVLAYTAATWVPFLIVLAVAPELLEAMTEALKPGAPIRIALLPVLTFTFFLARARSIKIARGTTEADPRWIQPLVLAAVVAFYEGMLVFVPTPLSLDARSVIIIVAFVLSLSTERPHVSQAERTS
jgi:preprotein translocase subunit SecY